MTPEQIAEIGVSGKGYWLFDRNSATVKRGEAIHNTIVGRLVINTLGGASYTYTRPNGPFAIYKWIPSHRS